MAKFKVNKKKDARLKALKKENDEIRERGLAEIETLFTNMEEGKPLDFSGLTKVIEDNQRNTIAAFTEILGPPYKEDKK